MTPYPPLIETQMRAFYESLSEKDRRRYAAVEAHKLGRGGITYMAQVLGCERHPISQGLRELNDATALAQTRIRRQGGGRKSSLATTPGLDEAFLQVLEDHTAGSPTQPEVKWTNLTQQDIVSGLQGQGIDVSVTVVKQLLKHHGFVKRKGQKKKHTGENPQRDAQFTKIAQLKKDYVDSPNPIISIDTKKKS